MAIVTDQTVTIHGVQVGISKPIQTLIANGDFTYAELSKFAYVGRYDFINDACAVYDNDNNEYGQSAQLLTLDKYPILNDPSKSWDTIWYQYHGSVGRTAATYGKMILLYDFNDARNSIKNDFTDSNTACVVTELNPRLLKMSPNVTLSTITASLGEPGTYTTYDVETSINISWYDDDSASPFRPLCVSEIDGHSYFYFPLYNNTLHARQNIAGNTDGTYAQLVDLQDSFDNTGDAFLSPWALSSPILDFCPGHDYGTTFIGAYKLNTSRADRLLILDYHGAWDFNGNLQVKASSLDAALKQCAACGLYFKVNGITYKPLTSGGIVTGYTTELDKNGEWDLINDVTGNTVPDTPTPPTPPPSSGDDMEAMATGATGSSGGFTHFYVMSSQDLIDFLADFYTRASSGETLTNNLVCSYILGIPSSEFCATEEVEIAIHNSAQGTPFVSKAKYSHITATNNLLVVGSFDVPRITNTFYDFAPYSTYEVFIPCCGWVALPDTVAGRRINVEMYIDIASCCLKAAVKTSDLGVCAVTNGVLGAAIPIAVIESGILRGNNIQAGLGIIGGGINTGVGAGSGNAMGIGFGVQQILNGLVECTIAGNTNYTQQKGGTGDITQFAMGHKCYMKVTHPEIDSVVNNSMFGHSVGYLCNSIGVLSGYTGFTVCGNPHVTFSASAEEREEIERLLSTGVIL